MNRDRLRVGSPWWGLILFGLTVLFHGLWAVADGYRVLEWFHIDDAFYYFVIARNVLEGYGVTFDRLGPTNGFQPLWLVVILPVFALGKIDLLLPLRALILVVGVLHGLTGWLLYRTARRFLSPWVALGLGASWSLGLGPWRFVSMGAMESPLNALALVTLWSVAVELHHRRAYLDPRWLRRLGWAMAFAFLSRLDNIFYALFFGLWWLYHAAREGRKQPAFWPRMARSLAWVVGPGLVLGGLYLNWNVLYVGTLIPTSARVKHWWGTLGGTPYGYPLGGNVFWKGVKSLLDPNIRTGPWGYTLAPFTTVYQKVIEPRLLEIPWLKETYRIRRLIIGYAPLLIWPALALLWTRRRWWPEMGRAALWPWFLAALTQGLYYDYIDHMAQRYWYWVGQMLFTHIFVALWLDVALVRRRPRVLGLSLQHPLWGVVILGLFAARLYVKAAPRPSPYPVDQHLYIDYARWVEAHTEPGSMVGATGAGSLAYFVQGRRVVALDGLVGPAAYVQALEQGRMVQYWKEKGLDYLVITPGMSRSSVYRGLRPYLEGLDWYEHPLEGWRIKLWRFHPEKVP